jgi:peptide/nickel transport system permease protein
MGAKVTMKPKRIASAWLLLFFAFAVFAHLHQAEIETYVLPDTLTFGNDAFGRNCFALLGAAAFETLKNIIPIGVVCLSLSFVAAILIALSSEKTEFLLRITLDTISSLPGFLIALALGVFFPNSEATLLLASFFLIFPWLTRFFESHLLSLSLKDYIFSARALGATPISIFFTHFFPELLRLLVSILPFLVTRLLVVETSLSFLGLGQVSEHETWGRLLYQGRDYLTEAPWILAFTGIPLCITLFSLHLLTRNDRI